MTGLWVTIAFIVGAIFGMSMTVLFFKRIMQRRAQKLAGKVGTAGLTMLNSLMENAGK